MTMKSGKVLVEKQDTVITITLNRPEKLNALDTEMLHDLEEAIRQTEGDATCRVVLVTGAGERAFCAGADIHAWGALEPLDMWRQWIRDGHRLFDRLASLRQPVIAALNGLAFGGGLELALAADIRLAAEHVELALPEVRIGAVPGWGGTQRLPALIGSGRAKQIIFTGDRIPAGQAAQWGLVNEVVSAAELLPQARALAARIAGNAPNSVAFAKQLVDGAGGSLTGQTLEALAGALAASTADGREGLAAFKEKREASFTGK